MKNSLKQYKDDLEIGKEVDKERTLQMGLLKFMLKGAWNGFLFGIIAPIIHVIDNILLRHTWHGWSDLFQSFLADIPMFVVGTVFIYMVLFYVKDSKVKKIE